MFIETNIQRLKNISEIDYSLPVEAQLHSLIQNYLTFYKDNPEAYKILKSCEERCSLEELSPEM